MVPGDSRGHGNGVAGPHSSFFNKQIWSSDQVAVSPVRTLLNTLYSPVSFIVQPSLGPTGQESEPLIEQTPQIVSLVH